MDYTYRIQQIYSKEDIEKAKNSPSFEREYNLKYLGRIGNIFNTREIELAIEKGNNYNNLLTFCTIPVFLSFLRRLRCQLIVSKSSCWEGGMKKIRTRV